MKNPIFLFVLLVLCVFPLAAETKAQTYVKYLKEHPIKYAHNDLPTLKSLEKTPVTIDFIKKKQGYYIQNQPRSFQEPNRSTVIFKLFTSGNDVYISKIDVQNGKELELQKILLNNIGNTYQSDEYKLAKKDNDLFIFNYLDSYNPNWTNKYPFTYQADLRELFDCAPIIKMTSDYLITLAGKYERYSLLTNEQGDTSGHRKPEKIINIEYIQNEKALKIRNTLFSETTFTEPFFWTYGEGAGFEEELYTFCDEGILYVYKMHLWSMETQTEQVIEDYAVYKRADSNDQIVERKVTENLRIRDSADLTTGTVLVSLKKYNTVTVLETGKKDYIDRMIGNWVKIKIKAGSTDKDNKVIPDDIIGWCFDGYLQ